MKTHIIIDSACDITKEEALQLDLHLLPLKILFGDTEYLDQVSLTPHEFYEKLIEEEHLPSTSQISPYDFEQLFEQIKAA